MTKTNFSLWTLKKATFSLKIALDEPKTAIARDATIQRLKYTYELTCKAMRRYFKLNNQLENEHMKGIFRKAGRQNLIPSAERWLEYQSTRNLTPYTYSEQVAEQVYKIAKPLLEDVESLIEQWEKILGVENPQ